MAEVTTEAHQSILLGLFKKSADGRLKAGDIKKKFKLGSEQGPDAAAADRALSGLIVQELLSVVGGSKEGHHPRPNASYRLTDKGKHHLRPPRPDVSDELLRNQEAFILLQIFRPKDRKLTRSDLNAKLKTVAAVRQLEFDVKEAPATVDFHLAMLIEKGCIDEQRRGNSVGYALNQEQGAKALASAKQHDAVSFTISGETLNALLEAARGSIPGHLEPTPPPTDERPEPSPTHKSQAFGADDVAKYVEHLRADKYSGKSLIPIYEVRRLVAEHHGDVAADHPSFDPFLKRMRSDGLLELIAISDSRGTSQGQLDDSIPGMNETIFYIVVD